MSGTNVGGFHIPQGVVGRQVDGTVSLQAGVRSGGVGTPDFETAAERHGISLGPGVELELDTDKSVSIELDRDDQDVQKVQFVLVEDGTSLRWVAVDDDRSVELRPDPRLPSADERGLVGSAVKKVIRWVAFEVLDAASAIRAFTALEETLRPHQLLDLRIEDGEIVTTPVEPESTLQGDVLLVVHGTGSSISGMLAKYDRSALGRLTSRYQRVLAFDHPTLAFSPETNASELLAQVGALNVTSARLHLLTHSRGGLLARQVLERETLPAGIEPGTAVFVGTPNTGTPLAAAEHALQLADVLTAPLALVPDNAVTDTLDIALEFVKVVAAKAMADLVGLIAQVPGSGFLSELNSTVPSEALKYKSISSAFQGSGDGISSALWLNLSEAVFSDDSDLVVPTSSVHGPSDQFGIGFEDRLVLRGRGAAHHLDYFSTPAVTSQLDSWLNPALSALGQAPPDPSARSTELRAEALAAFGRGDMDAYERIQALEEGEQDERGAAKLLLSGPLANPGRKKRSGTVILLPGVTGTHLGIGHMRIWVHLIRMMVGGMADLAVDGRSARGTTNVQPMGLMAVYEDITRFLLKERNVSHFGYDWRLSLEHSADALRDHIEALPKATQRKLTFVAHSMGGLVLRTFILRHPDMWKSLGSECRAVMLGTPNRGAHEPARNLVGKDPLLINLARFSVMSLQEVTTVMRSMPGVLQMLPRPAHGDIDLLSPDLWSEVLEARKELKDGELPAEFRNGLATARALTKKLDSQLDDPVFVNDPRISLIAGTGHPTPSESRQLKSGDLAWSQSLLGDGTVLEQHARLPEGMATYYNRSTHGGLAEDGAAFDAIEEILTTGTTSLLPTEPDKARGAGPQTVSIVAPETNTDIGITEFSEEAFLAASPWLPSGHSSRRQLHISVVHASLEQATYPVTVGHYRGLAPAGAEGFLDRKLGGEFSRAYDMGRYPENKDEALVVLPEGKHPPGGVVVGLGDFGDLSVSKLTASITSGASELLRRHASSGGTDDLGITAVLIGSPGNYDLTIPQSVQAIVTGVLRAIEAGDRGDRVGGPSISHLELIELYGDRADLAMAALDRLDERLPSELLDLVDIRTGHIVESRYGGLEQSAGRSTRSEGWLPYLIERIAPNEHDTASTTEVDEPHGPAANIGEFLITPQGQRARSAGVPVKVDFDKLESKLASTVARDAIWRQSVFADLVPGELQEQMSTADNLHLRLTADLAPIPWELLAARGDTSALSLRAGVVREFVDEQERPSFPHPTGAARHALVIGDPQTSGDFGSLPQAAAEARLVAALLEKNGFTVTLLIGEEADWLSVDLALKSADVSVVHIAAHGVIVDGDPNRTGVVLSDGKLLTAVDFTKMPRPDLIFLNTCHLGSTGQLSLAHPERFAANFAVELFRTDVRAVVAAAWQVEDGPARSFAQSFYAEMLQNKTFGEATRTARADAFADGHEGSLTWAAYQCYGTPGFRLPVEAGSGKSAARKYVSVRDFRLGVNSLINQADTSSNHTEIIERLQAIEAQYESLAGSDQSPAKSLELLGDAFRACGSPGHAAKFYERAVGSGDPSSSMRAIERIANARVKHVVEHFDTTSSAEVDRALADSENELQLLCSLSESTKRQTLLSSHYRREAYILHKRGNEPAGVVESLRQSFEAAYSAFKGQNDLYPVTGMTLAWILLPSKERPSKMTKGKLGELLVALGNRHKHMARAQGPKGVWDLQAEAFATLHLCLLQPDDTSNPALTDESIIDLYRHAWSIRANAAERNSTLGRLSLVRDMAGSRRGSLQRRATSLHEELAGLAPLTGNRS